MMNLMTALERNYRFCTVANWLLAVLLGLSATAVQAFPSGLPETTAFGQQHLAEAGEKANANGDGVDRAITKHASRLCASVRAASARYQSTRLGRHCYAAVQEVPVGAGNGRAAGSGASGPPPLDVAGVVLDGIGLWDLQDNPVSMLTIGGGQQVELVTAQTQPASSTPTAVSAPAQLSLVLGGLLGVLILRVSSRRGRPSFLTGPG
jgi:hypothetical protein